MAVRAQMKTSQPVEEAKQTLGPLGVAAVAASTLSMAGVSRAEAMIACPRRMGLRKRLNAAASGPSEQQGHS